MLCLSFNAVSDRFTSAMSTLHLRAIDEVQLPVALELDQCLNETSGSESGILDLDISKS